jgi:hypothetical protein
MGLRSVHPANAMTQAAARETFSVDVRFIKIFP